MTLEKVLRDNPYDKTRGNESAYARYLRYNVDGYYDLTNEEVKRRWKRSSSIDGKELAEAFAEGFRGLKEKIKDDMPTVIEAAGGDAE